jgi:hypothetical protein
VKYEHEMSEDRMPSCFNKNNWATTNPNKEKRDDMQRNEVSSRGDLGTCRESPSSMD